MDKRYLYIIFLVLINLNVAFADKRSDVKTPAGSSVEAWICDEMSASQRASLIMMQ